MVIGVLSVTTLIALAIPKKDPISEASTTAISEVAPPPAYAVGVAYPALGLVLLTLSAPDTWERPDLDRVFIHELAHVATHRAAGGNGVPRWLDEGIAIHVAGENPPCAMEQ